MPEPPHLYQTDGWVMHIPPLKIQRGSVCESCRASLTFIMDDEGASFLSDGVIISRKPEHGILEGHGGVCFFFGLVVFLFVCFLMCIFVI